MALVSMIALSGLGEDGSAGPTTDRHSEIPAAPGSTLPKVYAVVDGEPISLADVEAEGAEELEELRFKRLQAEAIFRRRQYEARAAALRRLVEQRLLEAEATRRNLPRRELLELLAAEEDEPRSSPGPSPDPLSELDQRPVPSWLPELLDLHSVEILLPQLRYDASHPAAPVWGPAVAPVTIVEFVDYECSFCARLAPVLSSLKRSYGEQISLQVRPYPLAASGQRGYRLAQAALCAERQQLFWSFHHRLLEEQESLAEIELHQLASMLEPRMDLERFRKCLEDGETEEIVRRSQRDAAQLGVLGTPTLFVNGRYLPGAIPLERLEPIVRSELARSISPTPPKR